MPRSPRRNHPSPRSTALKAIVAGLAAAAVLYGLGEWQLFQARAAENETLRARLDLIRLDNANTELMIADYDDFKSEADAVEARFATALSAVPTEAELAGALDDLQRVTAASGVSLIRFTPSGSTATPASSPTAPPASSAAVHARQITVAVRCSFDAYRDLLARLAAYPRLLTVESFSMKGASAGEYTIEASIGLNCYFKEAPPESLATTSAR